jgi:phage-related protein
MADKDLEFWDDEGAAFRKIVRSWPKAVRSAIGADIRRIQQGKEPRNWKPLQGFAVAAAEVRHKDGARVVYSVAFAQESGQIFIADAFMKDSSDGSEMRKSDRIRIEGRLKRYRLKRQKARRPVLH